MAASPRLAAPAAGQDSPAHPGLASAPERGGGRSAGRGCGQARIGARIAPGGNRRTWVNYALRNLPDAYLTRLEPQRLSTHGDARLSELGRHRSVAAKETQNRNPHPPFPSCSMILALF